MNLEKLRFPVGKFHLPETVTSDHISNWTSEIELAPSQYFAATEGLTDEQLDTPYRPDGWTLRQVVHHVADSHMNSYIRFKWTLTENTPTIKAYDETVWAKLEDAKSAPIELSLKLIEALHGRWVVMIKNLSETDLAKTFIHPENGKTISLEYMVGLYAWHSRHHLGHINALKESRGW